MSQGFTNPKSITGTVDIGGATTSAFGTLETGELTPLIQLDFVYGINTQTGVSSVANAATIDTNASRLRLQSGTNSAGSAIFTSRNTVKYRPGLGITARFTGVYATGTANNTQTIGVGTSSDGYFFGYNGTAFGILHRNAGVNTWVAQTVWNQDKCDGLGPSGFNWNPQTGNVMMIKYPYLGFGSIRFYVENPTTGSWILCHIIAYPNTVQAVQMSNPNLNFYAQNLNSGNTTNLTMYVGSVGIFLSGIRSFIGSPKWAADNNKAAVTTETNIITLRNCNSFNGVTNKSLIRLHHVSFSISANATATLKVKLNPTLGGSPSYTTINGSTSDSGVTITNGNSITSYDVAGTTVTGGIYLFNSVCAQAGGGFGVDLTPYDIFMVPGDILTFSVTSTNSVTAGVSVNWSEDL